MFVKKKKLRMCYASKQRISITRKKLEKRKEFDTCVPHVSYKLINKITSLSQQKHVGKENLLEKQKQRTQLIMFCRCAFASVANKGQ